MANQDIYGPARQGQQTAAGFVDTVEKAGSTIAAKAEEAWNATCGEAKQLGSNVAQSAENAWDDVNNFIRRYPLAVFAGGFVVGFLVRQTFSSYSPEMTRRMSQYSA